MSFAYRKAKLKDEDQNAKARFVEADFSKSTSITSQAPTAEADINKIMAKIEKGHPILTNAGTPFYGDVSDLGGLQEAIMKVQEADDLFSQFPAEIRAKFENDPVNLVSFLEDPENYDEALKLGIVNPKPSQQAPVPEPAPTPAAGKPPTQ